jgi:hypothetical protein
MLSTGHVGLKEKSPMHVADVVRMMSVENITKRGSGEVNTSENPERRSGGVNTSENPERRSGGVNTSENPERRSGVEDTRGNQARGGQNGPAIKITERGRADGNIFPRSVTFANQQPPAAGQLVGMRPGREVAMPGDSARDQPNPKGERSGEENGLKATHGKIVQRYDETHSKLDLNVIIPSIDDGLNAENTENVVSHKWAPHEETATEKRPSRKQPLVL